MYSEFSGPLQTWYLQCHEKSSLKLNFFFLVNISQFLFSKDLGPKYFQWPLESYSPGSASRPHGRGGQMYRSQPEEWTGVQEVSRCFGGRAPGVAGRPSMTGSRKGGVSGGSSLPQPGGGETLYSNRYEVTPQGNHPPNNQCKILLSAKQVLRVTSASVKRNS